MDDKTPDPIIGLADGIEQLHKRLGEAIATSKTAKEDNPEAVSERSVELEKFNENYAVVLRGTQALIMRVGYDGKTESREIGFLGKGDFLLLNQNKQFKSRFTPKPVFLAKSWLEWKHRKQYEGIVFRPGLPAEIDSEVSFGEHGKQFNLWRGFSFEEKEPSPDNPTANFSWFLDHLRVNLCHENEKYYEWVIAWMADIFQHPERKSGTALVMRGKMGTGKGNIARVLGTLISRHYISITQTSQIVGKFNGHLADKILVFLDEPPWAGDKAAEGVLRALITEPTLSIEQKGRDVIQLENYCHFILSTNHDWAVPTGMMDERRFAVFDMGEARRGDKPYFGAMFEQLKHGGYPELLWYLRHHEYDPTILDNLPDTNALMDQKTLSMPHWMSWWHEKLHEGSIIQDQRWPEEIDTNDLYREYISWCENMRVPRPLDKMWLSRRIKEKCCPSLTSAQTTGGRRVVRLENLKNCRIEFQDSIGHKIDWEDGEKTLFDGE